MASAVVVLPVRNMGMLNMAAATAIAPKNRGARYRFLSMRSGVMMGWAALPVRKLMAVSLALTYVLSSGSRSRSHRSVLPR